MHKILVNVMREEIRMAVIDEKEQLIDFVLERTDESHMANHMYKGTVKNVYCHAYLWCNKFSFKW